MIVGGKYELVRKIGTGAMGEVWAARHKTLDEEVAIKLVLRNVDHEDGTSAESRFLLEARVAAALSRKTRHIVAVTDHGQDGALGYLVMELLAGESLDVRIARTGPLPVSKVSPMITQIARGLSIAHGEGVVHRDLKPSNVFVTLDEDGNAVAKVLDFGIAKLRRGLDRKSAHATQRGFLLGTPAYMSSEQARGKPIDHRADVWALAVIAYHMLTGEFPFDGESGEELFARICRIEPISIRDRRPDLPKIVDDFFARAFAPRIEDRFQSALSLAGAFEMLEPLAAGAKLSLPPPVPALSLVSDDLELAGLHRRDANERGDRTTLDGPSLFVAGVPRKKKMLPLLLAGMLVGAVLVTTGVTLSVYFEREPARPAAGMTSAPSTPDPNSLHAIPPPEPAAEKASGPSVMTTPDDLPGAPAAITPRVTRAASRTTGSGATSDPAIDPARASATMAAVPQPPPPPAAAPTAKSARSVDKSEVF
jgi:serine/threonine-protein kinase